MSLRCPFIAVPKPGTFDGPDEPARVKNLLNELERRHRIAIELQENPLAPSDKQIAYLETSSGNPCNDQQLETGEWIRNPIHGKARNRQPPRRAKWLLQP